jgi:alpha,alpha-trehalase
LYVENSDKKASTASLDRELQRDTERTSHFLCNIRGAARQPDRRGGSTSSENGGATVKQRLGQTARAAQKAQYQRGEPRHLPKHLIESWRDIVSNIRRVQRVALLSDFDGTLVRIQRDPDAVHLSPAIKTLLSEISATGATVGVISGRKLGDVRARVGVPRIWYVGSHGLMLRPPMGPAISAVKPREQKSIASAQRALHRRLDRLEGLAVAVHYRNAPWQSQIEGLRAVYATLKRLPGLRLLKGKKVWELVPESPTGKWSGIERILERETHRETGRSPLTIYLGDDTSDEEVFEKLAGISVVVGKHSHTKAQYYLQSPAEVHHFLEMLLGVVG